jgi:hypothetical protein
VGQAEGEGYFFFGFVLGAHDFRNLLLSALQTVRGLNGETAQRDLKFTGGKLTDVVPAPDV